jgi:hypothetical protein
VGSRIPKLRITGTQHAPFKLAVSELEAAESGLFLTATDFVHTPPSIGTPLVTLFVVPFTCSKLNQS